MVFAAKQVRFAPLTGSGYGSGSTGSGGSTARNPASKTQKKKKAAKDKAAAGGKPAATREKDLPAGAKPTWKKGEEGRD
jgi:hypothetical protein